MNQRQSGLHARRRLRSAGLMMAARDLRDYAATLPREDADSVMYVVGKMEYMAAHPPPVTAEEALKEMFGTED